MREKKKVFIRSWGCQMNVRDTELVYGLLTNDGYVKADSIENADVILFNTCSVRKHAEDRVYGKVGLLKRWKEKNPHVILGIIGCMAQSHRESIFNKLPHVDFICGPANIYDIPDLVKKVADEGKHLHALDEKQRLNIEQPAIRESSVSAYVSISEGCDNFCSYCIVPYVRGRHQSRPKKLILDEIRKLADSGYKEVILLGQNVNAYCNVVHGPRTTVHGPRSMVHRNDGFVKLLGEVNKIEGIERIRFVTSHPKGAFKDLFKAMRDLDKVCEHLHLPLQSGSDRILKRMNRGYTSKKYLKLIEDYRNIVHHSSLTTDVIVGFSGEQKKDFQDTYDMMEEIRFDSAFIFKYSPRPPAKSSEYKDNVTKEVKEERNQTLLRLQEGISRRINEKLVGKDIGVLVESGNSKGKEKSLRGRTWTNKIAVFDGGFDLLKKIVDVKIKRVTPHTLIGDVVSNETW